MTKTYFNNAITGNSSMLCCFTDRGELVRLFWPNIDYPQHIERLSVGIFTPGEVHSTMWLEGDGFRRRQKYIGDTAVLETVFENYERGIKIKQTDFCTVESDMLVRHYEIQNLNSKDLAPGFMLYSSSITSHSDSGGVKFDFTTESLIHYRHGYYVAVSSNLDAKGFQLGNNAYDSACYTDLKGSDSIGMMSDGAVSWVLGVLKPGEIKTFTLSICLSKTLKGVKGMVWHARKMDVNEELLKTRKYWSDFLAKAVKVDTGRDDIDNLYKRSLIVFRLTSDESSGGLLAAPEIDEGFTRCGKYAYCWGRDAAFITGALDRCGLHDSVEKFYEWARLIQDDDGSWEQRYHMDGNLAPSWGLQVDETGTLIWGMLQHYKATYNMEFLKKMWYSIKAGVEFLVGFIDTDTSLPKPSFDLWEERFGEHTYSSAAVYGGICAGIEAAGILNIKDDEIAIWKKVSTDIKDAMEKLLWKEEHNCFLRSIRTKLNPWGSEHSGHTTVIEVNPKGYKRDVTLEDWTIDISLLGVSIPFGVFDSKDIRVEKTAETIERVLTSYGVGGIRRYENDNYIGGNPWVLTTLWAALYHIERKEFTKAKEYFEWAVKARTELDLLPEQVSKDTGKPAWVIPLTWSHAMFVLVLFALSEAGMI